LPGAFPFEALDDRIAIVGTAGSGKTYAAKGFVERLLDSGTRVAIVDPLGVWWGLRASADLERMTSRAGSWSTIVFLFDAEGLPLFRERSAPNSRKS
jgi:DNA helicase HerA-like ATPase